MVTPPMLFVLFGVLVCDHLIGVFPVDLESPAIHLVAELTLILIFFTDASRISLPALLKDHAIPVRPLAIGLPLTILLGAVVVAVVCDVLAGIGSDPCADRCGPGPGSGIEPARTAANSESAEHRESGLNDGIALPVVLLTFMIFGALMAPTAIIHLELEVVLYSLLSLTVPWL